jgi:hypothetical protein
MFNSISDQMELGAFDQETAALGEYVSIQQTNTHTHPLSNKPMFLVKRSVVSEPGGKSSRKTWKNDR